MPLLDHYANKGWSFKSLLTLRSGGCSLLRAEGFSCSLWVFHGGLGISKLQFLIKKIYKKFSSYKFDKFLIIKTRIRNWIRIRD
jgi:hypothetical protein